MYNQELHVGIPLSLVEQYLGKVYGKNYLDDELLYKKFVGWKNILGEKKTLPKRKKKKNDKL